MIKRPVFFVACAFGCGIHYAIFRDPLILLIGGIVLLCGTVSPLRAKKRGWFFFAIFIYLTALALGYSHGAASEHRKQIQQNGLYDGQSIDLCGKIVKRIPQKTRTAYLLREQEPVEGRLVLLYENKPQDFKVGETVICNGTVSVFAPARNFGNFDAKTYYQSLGIAVALYDAVKLKSDGKYDLLAEWYNRLHIQIRQRYGQYLPTDTANALLAMVWNDKSGLSETVEERYRRAGIAHVFAVSGLHLSILVLGLYHFLRKRRVSFACAAAVGTLIGWGYLGITGNGIATQRALFMLLLVLWANVCGRSCDMLNSLGACFLILLWSNPYYLQNTGFLLSFAAVGGVAVWNLFGNRKWTPVGIALFTYPVMLWFFYYLSLYAVFLNLIVLALMPVLLGMAFAGTILCAVIAPAHLLLYGCKLILDLFLWLCDLSSHLPFACLIRGRPSISFMIIYYMILLFGIYCLNRHPVGKSVLIAGLLLALIVPKSRPFSVAVLDVGQGDGTYIHTKSGMNLFFDGGSSDIGKVGSNRIRPFLEASGAGRIDYWFLSHLDEDHYNGLCEMLDGGYPVSHIVMSDFSAHTLHDDAPDLYEAIQKNQIDVITMSKGSLISDESIRIDCLWPQKGTVADRNDASLSLVIRTDTFNGLICGDLPSFAEQQLVPQLENERVDWYKCNHHGSNYSSMDEFLSCIRPTYTTISCSLHNHYGHPGKECVSRLLAVGSQILYTMDSGQISLFADQDGIKIEKFLIYG